MDPLASIKEHDRNHFMAVWHQTLIAVWWGPATANDVQRMIQAGRALLREAPERAQFLLVIEETSPTPVGAALESFKEFTRDVVMQLSPAVVVAEGSGFRVASIRSVAAALALALPKKLPFTFVDSIDQAALALAPKLSDEAGGAAGFARAINAMRASPKGRRPA